MTLGANVNSEETKNILGSSEIKRYDLKVGKCVHMGNLKVMSITFVYDAFLLRKTSTQYILNIISCPLYIHLTFVIFNS